MVSVLNGCNRVASRPLRNFKFFLLFVMETLNETLILALIYFRNCTKKPKCRDREKAMFVVRFVVDDGLHASHFTIVTNSSHEWPS